jgi:ribonuclease G
MNKKILVNVRPNQTRVAFLNNERLIDLQIDQSTSPTLVGGIYKGKVERVLPGMQAAFVDIGLERSAFLYVGDVLQNLEETNAKAFSEKISNTFSEDDESGIALKLSTSAEQTNKTPIQDLLKEGQMILCQVAKDPLGTKGARITTHISLPGRTVVFMPNIPHLGISKKIEDEKERNRLKNIIEKGSPRGGVIVRTAAEGLSKVQIIEDLGYLDRLWKDVSKNYTKRKTPGCFYRDLDLELRAIRDNLTAEVTAVVVDDRKTYKKITAFINQFMPKFKNVTEFYNKPQPLFDVYSIDLEITRSLGRKIWLKSGGYLVFDEAEALVVIDVNTGRYVGKKDLDETILQTNLEAAQEIAHQLRIRNCGGIIIVDFIDMEKEAHKEQVVKLFSDELALDRSKTKITDISELGLVEMTRKRIRPSLVSTLTKSCTYCDGKGYIKRRMTVANEIFRALEREAERPVGNRKVYVECHSDIADWIYEEDAATLDFIEARLESPVVIKVNQKLHIEEFVVSLK